MNASEGNGDVLSWQDLRQHALGWVAFFYQIAQFFVRTLRQYWLLSFGLMGVFALIMVGLLYMQSKTYQMTTTFVYGDLHPKIFGDMISKLNAVIEFGQTEKVADLMGLNLEQAEKLKKVIISDIKGKDLVSNYTFNKAPMIISLNLSDPVEEDSLRTAISNYLNSNPFTAKRLPLRRKQLQEELVYIDAKLKTIDSVLVHLYERPANLGAQKQGAINIENAEGKNAYELLSFSRELLQRKADIERTLINVENVFAIDNFILLPKAKMDLGGIIKNVIIGAFIGYILSCIIVFWRNYLKPMVV